MLLNIKECKPAISAGGGQGILFNLSLVVEENIVAVVQERIERMEQTLYSNINFIKHLSYCS